MIYNFIMIKTLFYDCKSLKYWLFLVTVCTKIKNIKLIAKFKGLHIVDKNIQN